MTPDRSALELVDRIYGTDDVANIPFGDFVDLAAAAVSDPNVRPTGGYPDGYDADTAFNLLVADKVRADIGQYIDSLTAYDDMQRARYSRSAMVGSVKAAGITEEEYEDARLNGDRSRLLSYNTAFLSTI